MIEMVQDPRISRSATVRRTLVQQLFVIDSQVAHTREQPDGVDTGAIALTLSPDQDGIQEISTILRNHPTITQIDIMAPCRPGCLHLGNTELNATNLERYAWDLQGWFASAYTQGSCQCPTIRIRGRQIKQGSQGSHLIRCLQQLTGAEIVVIP